MKKRIKKKLNQYRPIEIVLASVAVGLLIFLLFLLQEHRVSQTKTEQSSAIKQGPLVKYERGLQADINIEKGLANQGATEEVSNIQSEAQVFKAAGDGYETNF